MIMSIYEDLSGALWVEFQTNDARMLFGQSQLSVVANAFVKGDECAPVRQSSAENELIFCCRKPNFRRMENIITCFSERENGAKPNILIGQKFHHATTVSVSATATGYHSFPG